MARPPIAEMISQGGREGVVEASGDGLSVQLRAPGSPGDDQAITPEHLFGGAFAACYHSAVKRLASNAHLDIPGSTVMARVRLEDDARNEWKLGVELRVSLPNVSRPDGEHLLHEALKSCPYAKAVRDNIVVDVVLD